MQVNDEGGYYIAAYTYGSGNERLISDEGGYRTYYAWSGEAVIAEYGETSSVLAWTKSYVFLGARLLATLTPNGVGGESTQFHHPDRLGTRLITNAADNNYFEQVSLPYGTALDAESSGATNRRFTSYDRSASSGLDYAINRHYDSQQGRFTQADPVGMGASSLADPQSLNMYAYCGGDPINRTDPSGLFWGKLFRGILKVLSNKWVQLAIAVAIIVIAHYYPNSIFGLGGGTSGAHAGSAPVLHYSATSAAAAGAQPGAGSLAALFRAITPTLINEGAVVAGSGLASGASLVLAGALGVGAVSDATQKQAQKQQRQQQQKSECPSYAMDFFNKYGAIFDKMSQQVGTHVNHIASLAALESRWGLHPTAIARNNIWGMKYKGKIITFRRVDPYDYWVQRFGSYANGATTIEQFGSQLKPIYAPEDKGWYDALVNRHKQLQEFRKNCGI